MRSVKIKKVSGSKTKKVLNEETETNIKFWIAELKVSKSGIQS